MGRNSYAALDLGERARAARPAAQRRGRGRGGAVMNSARKMNIPAPMRVKADGAYWMKVENDFFVTAPEIMYDEVASRADCKGDSGCSAVCVEVEAEADLLRFAAL